MPCKNEATCIFQASPDGAVRQLFGPGSGAMLVSAAGASDAYVLAGVVDRPAGDASTRGLLEFPVDGGAPVLIAPTFGVLAAGSSFYYIGPADGGAALFSFPADIVGGPPIPLALLPPHGGLDLPYPQSVVDGFAYFVEEDTGFVYRIAIPGGMYQPVATIGVIDALVGFTYDDVAPFFVGGGYLFYSAGPSVMRVPVTGGTPSTLLPNVPLWAGELGYATIALAGSPPTLFVVGETTVEAYSIDGAPKGTRTSPATPSSPARAPWSRAPRRTCFATRAERTSIWSS